MNQTTDGSNKISRQTWLRYQKTKDIGLRNEILMAYLHIVTYSLRKAQIFLKNRDDAEDMASDGVLELINCIDRFDIERGVQFDSYASIRVRGAIIDYVRKKDWVSRDVRRKIKQINQMDEKLQIELGRFPTEAELAEHLNMEEAELAKARSDEANYQVVSFEETLSSTGLALIDVTADAEAQMPERHVLEDDFKRQLAQFIDELDEKERTVISLYYFEEIKLKEIAFVLNLSASRVSQIHSRALSKLKAGIQEYMEE
jgi:RNA polymerase sigma factor for flagellar operon FliA